MAKVLFVVSFPDNISGDGEESSLGDPVEDISKATGSTYQEKRLVKVEDQDDLEKTENDDDCEEEKKCEEAPHPQDMKSPDSAFGDQNICTHSVPVCGDYGDAHSTHVTETDLKKMIGEHETENLIESNIMEGEENPEMVRLISQESRISLLEDVKQTLSLLHVAGVQWSNTEDNIHVGMFITDYGNQCELIIKRLSMLKIGIMKNSSINIFPASICIEEKPRENVQTHLESEDRLIEKVSEFRKSIKSRLVVDQVVAVVQGDAMFTFDFLMLVILASFVAVMGLLEANSVVLVASMLISPLMGPILAAVFGTVIRKSDLISVGVLNEIKGLAICILVGFLLGFIPACLEVRNYEWRSFATEWPTIEMSSRGALRSLPVGILIAVPSGAGVALSVLGGKIGSLVGVAISASLLPPAVNAGLLWANAIVVAVTPPQEATPRNLLAGSRATLNNITSDHKEHRISDCPQLMNNDFVPLYSCNMAFESLIMGFVSLSLTILNIICIILMGILVLKLKEVAPIFRNSAQESEKDFFCKDLKVARESYVTTKGKSAAAMREQWLSEYKALISKQESSDDKDEGGSDADEEIDDIIESVQDSPTVKEIVDKMPVRPKRWSQAVLSSSISSNGNNSTFSFKPQNALEDDFQLLEHCKSTPKDYPSPADKGLQNIRDKAVYFTVHKFIPPKSLMSSTTSSWKRGKLLPKLKVPQESRFMVAKIEEPCKEENEKRELSALPEEVRKETNDQRNNESEPLLTHTTSL